MARLLRAHQTFIVQSLACFDSPTEVAEAVKEEFGIDVDRRQVQYYDPTKGSPDKKLPLRWKMLFEATRERFLKDSAEIGIAHQAYRLRQLQRLYHGANRNAGLRRELLEHAAKEVGGAFTNRRELTGQDGQPIQVERVNRQQWAESQLKQFMKEFKLTRVAAIERMRRDAPTVVKYLGVVG